MEVEFDQELAEVREELRRSPELAEASPPLLPVSLAEELARLAEASPRAAALEAFAGNEARLDEMLHNADVTEASTVSGTALARLAHRRGLVSDKSMAAVEGLRVIQAVL